jgi:SAM-dependent MidA family methyltransferase
VRWCHTPREALAAAGGRALIVSNELVDAFPPKLLVFEEGAWREVFLELGEGRLEEVYAPPSDPRLLGPACSLPRAFTDPPEGQRVEVHWSYRGWLAGWLPGLDRGAMLTIDYGDTAERLYHRRKAGSLRAYFRHFRFEGEEVYERFARQDLTADVNFTDLIRWGEELGLATRSYATQREFLLAWNPRLAARPTPAAEFLLSPEGAGEAFKVLEQVRKVSGQPV